VPTNVGPPGFYRDVEGEQAAADHAPPPPTVAATVDGGRRSAKVTRSRDSMRISATFAIGTDIALLRWSGVFDVYLQSVASTATCEPTTARS